MTHTSLYFYHPDHLGTSTFLTDGNGQLYQFYLNLPFGETMTEQHSLTEDYETPFKFNGKELDNETGYYYYGARYYDPKLSIFISVDPLAETSPDWTPYRYGFNNPIRYTDPTGMLENDDLYIKGADADLAVKELNDDSELNLVRDSNTGKVTMADKSKINYDDLTCEDQELYNIIEDHNKTVNVTTTQDYGSSRSWR